MKWSRLCQIIIAHISLSLGWLQLNCVFAQDEESDLASFFIEVPELKSTQSNELESKPIESLEPDPERLIVDDKKKKKFAGWGPYERNIKAICAAIASDGRALELKSITESEIGGHEHCSACTSLFKVVAKNCQPRKKKEVSRRKKIVEKGDEAPVPADLETPVPSPPALLLQREPSVLVRIVGEIFIEHLAEDPKRAKDGAAALSVFRKLLLSLEAKGAPKGQQDYFRDLAEILASKDDKDERNEEENINRTHENNLHVGGAAPADVNELFN